MEYIKISISHGEIKVEGECNNLDDFLEELFRSNEDIKNVFQGAIERSECLTLSH